MQLVPATGVPAGGSRAIVDGDRAFVAWCATFDCEAGCRDELTGTLRRSFRKWLESLRDVMAAKAGFPPEQRLAAVSA
jgi:hypothetical protein